MLFVTSCLLVSWRVCDICIDMLMSGGLDGLTHPSQHLGIVDTFEVGKMWFERVCYAYECLGRQRSSLGFESHAQLWLANSSVIHQSIQLILNGCCLNTFLLLALKQLLLF